MNGTQLSGRSWIFVTLPCRWNQGWERRHFVGLWANVPDAWIQKEPGGQPVPLGASAGADKMSALPVQTAAPRQAPNCAMTSLH